MNRSRWSTRIGVLALTCALPTSALAQTDETPPEVPPAEAEPPAEPPPEAEPPAPPAEAEKPDPVWDEARRYLRQGEALFEAENYEAALTEFEKAYEHMQGHPKQFYVLDNIGMCHERMFRYDLALKYFQRFLDEGGPDAPDRPAVEASIRALGGLLATLKVESNVAAEVWVDDRMMGEAPGDVLIPGGRHVVELRAAGHEPVRREVHITARETQTQTFVLDPIEEYQGLSPTYFWTGAGLTVVTAAVGGYFGLRALSQDADGQDRHDELGAVGNTPEDEDQVKRSALTADILYGTAGLFALGTTLLYFMTDWGPEAELPPSETPAAALSPVVGPRTLGLGMTGRF